MRAKAVVEYMGTHYAGWQVQPNAPTVQGALEEALRTVTGTSVRVFGAGRTDSGVHAAGQVAAFDVPEGTDLYRLRHSMNALTGHDIVVVELEEVSSEFDPRGDAVLRSYRYTVLNGRPPSPFLRDRSWHVYGDLDVATLERVAEHLVGDHDFSAFRASDCVANRTRRTIQRSCWIREGHVLHYEIDSEAFLKQMVRVLVGSMVDVAQGRLAEEEFLRLLGGGERTEAGKTAPAAGLTLIRVLYPT